VLFKLVIICSTKIFHSRCLSISKQRNFIFVNFKLFIYIERYKWIILEKNNFIIFILSMFKDNPVTKNHLLARFNTSVYLIFKSPKSLAMINTIVPSANNRELEYDFIPWGRSLISSKKRFQNYPWGTPYVLYPIW